MPETLKILGQAAPAAATDAAVLTVGAGKAVVVGSLTVCNTVNVSTTFRVHVRIAGAAAAASNAVVYDATLGANETVFLLPGPTLAATDVVTVRAAAAGVTFTLTGVEVT
jgi:hypothetical protein